MTDGVLVVGYGNSLRTDDGAGRSVAERLMGDPRMGGAVLSVHQLTPELALDLSRAAGVVFVDAGAGQPSGTFSVERLEESPFAATSWSHHLDPASLVALAGELFGHAPRAWIVTIGAESFAVGDRLSPAVDGILPAVVDAVVDLAVGAGVGHA